MPGPRKRNWRKIASSVPKPPRVATSARASPGVFRRASIAPKEVVPSPRPMPGGLRPGHFVAFEVTNMGLNQSGVHADQSVAHFVRKWLGFVDKIGPKRLVVQPRYQFDHNTKRYRRVDGQPKLFFVKKTVGRFSSPVLDEKGNPRIIPSRGSGPGLKQFVHTEFSPVGIHSRQRPRSSSAAVRSAP